MPLRVTSSFPTHTSVCCFFLMLIIPLNTKAASDSLRHKVLFQSSVGYSFEDLNWSIAGINAQGVVVDVLSELKWKDLRGIRVAFVGEWFVWKGVLLRMDFSKTFISSGTVTDTDFNKSNRRDTVFHERFESDRGSVTGCSGAGRL